jgi:hypothetical protein
MYLRQITGQKDKQPIESPLSEMEINCTNVDQKDAIDAIYVVELEL